MQFFQVMLSRERAIYLAGRSRWDSCLHSGIKKYLAPMLLGM